MGSEVAGGKDSQQTQPKTKNPIVSTVRLVLAAQPSGSSAQEIDKRVSLDCESTNVRMERPVESEQSIGLFTQREEIDIDFRVSGLPHAVVKEAENVSVQELVKKIESHTHREALQADLQQNNVYNPFSGQCRIIRVVRNNSESAMFSMSSLLEPRNYLLHLRAILG